MERLPLGEARRLIAYLRAQPLDAGRLLEIEGQLLGDEAGSLLREESFLTYFPAITNELIAGGINWQLRFIPHARVRMTQRGVKSEVVLNLFTRFVERSLREEGDIVPGPYTIRQPASGITIRIDIDIVGNDSASAHLVTVFFGRMSEMERSESE